MKAKKINLKKALMVFLSLAAALGTTSCSEKEATAEAYAEGSAYAYAEAYCLYIVNDDTIQYTPSDERQPLNNAELAIADKIDDYAVSMLIDYSDNDNIFLSPVSATTLYSMMANFVGDGSGNLFKENLGLEDYDMSDINSYNRKINYQSSLGEQGDSSMFAMKNNLWLQENSTVYNSFISTANAYNTFVKGVDIKGGEGIEEINSDINGTSDGGAKNINNYLNSNTSSVITTILNLKKEWKHTMTAVTDTFTNIDYSTAPVDYLAITEELKYAQFDGFDIVEIPFEDGALSAYVVYPDDGGNLKSCLSYIQSAGLDECVERLSKKNINLRIPEIKASGISQLNKQNLSSSSGIRQMYSMQLDKVSPDGFSCGDAFQSYDIDINKKGISVKVKSTGAVTGGTWTGSGAGRGRGGTGGSTTTKVVKKIHLTHPFALLVRNNDLKFTIYACIINKLD